MKENSMNLIVAIDDNYLEPLKTMLYSLICNNSDDSIKVFLLYGDDLSKRSRKSLSAFLKKFNTVELEKIYIDRSVFGDAPRLEYWGEEIYFRILSPYILPVDRALWLDADIIVNKSLHELYFREIDDAYIVAAKDIGGIGESAVQRLGLPQKHIYFNSGVILFNLKRIRDEISKERFFKCISDNKEILLYPDQDVLNICLQDGIKYCNCKLYNNAVWGTSVLSKDILYEINNEAHIIHFYGPVKPWNSWYNLGKSRADELWWRYEKRRGRYLQACIYRIKRFSALAKRKFKFLKRELYYIILAQWKKLFH